MYSGNSCCSETRDSQIAANMSSLNVPTASACYNILKQLSCSKCDQWAAHIVGGEQDIALREVPRLCPSYCQTVYSTCRDVALNPNFPPFFLSRIGFSQFYLEITSKGTAFPDAQSFCSAYSVSKGYCFSGNPYQPSTTLPTNTSRGLCLELVIPAVPGRQDMISFAASKDGKIFAATRDGIIKVYQKTATGLFTDLGVFLNMTSRTQTTGEGGVLGMQVHPNFLTNGRFFVSFTCDIANGCVRNCTRNSDCLYGGPCTGGICSDHQLSSIIDEYQVSTWNPLRANPSSFKNIYNTSQPGPNHNAGQIQFGPDGFLYISFGDGGGLGAALSQQLSSPMGKILRIDVDNPNDGRNYGIPSDNPFINVVNATKEIWALGFRNPWRGSFDSLTGELYVGDVGMDLVEEMDIVEKGGNYGWRKYEGYNIYSPNDILPTPAQVKWPNLFYYHSDMGTNSGACIIGGHVYRGTADTCNKDYYIFADQLQRFLIGVENPIGSRRFDWSFLNWACFANPGVASSCVGRSLGSIYSFGEDADKDLYVLVSPGVLRLVENEKCPSLQCSPLGVTNASSTTGQQQTVTTSQQQSVTTGTSVTTSSQQSVTTGINVQESATTGTGTCIPSSITWQDQDKRIMMSQSMTGGGNTISVEGRYEWFSPGDPFEIFIQYIFTNSTHERRRSFKARAMSFIEFRDTGVNGFSGESPIQTFSLPSSEMWNNFVPLTTSPNTLTTRTSNGIYIATGVLDITSASCITTVVPRVDLFFEIDFRSRWSFFAAGPTKGALRVRYQMFETVRVLATGVISSTSFPGDWKPAIFEVFGSVPNRSIGVDSLLNTVEIPVLTSTWSDLSNADGTIKQYDVFYTFDTVNRAYKFTDWKLASSRVQRAPQTTGQITTQRLTTGQLTSGPVTTRGATSSSLTTGQLTSGPVTTTSGFGTTGLSCSGPCGDYISSLLSQIANLQQQLQNCKP